MIAEIILYLTFSCRLIYIFLNWLSNASPKSWRILTATCSGNTDNSSRSCQKEKRKNKLNIKSRTKNQKPIQIHTRVHKTVIDSLVLFCPDDSGCAYCFYAIPVAVNSNNDHFYLIRFNVIPFGTITEIYVNG